MPEAAGLHASGSKVAQPEAAAAAAQNRSRYCAAAAAAVAVAGIAVAAGTEDSAVGIADSIAGSGTA